MDILNLKLADLQTFCIVMEQGSITGAALALAQTKEAVAKRIERLEQLAGEPLFDHTMRTSQATHMAVELFDALSPTFSALMETLTRSSDQAASARIFFSHDRGGFNR